MKIFNQNFSYDHNTRAIAFFAFKVFCTYVLLIEFVKTRLYTIDNELSTKNFEAMKNSSNLSEIFSEQMTFQFTITVSTIKLIFIRKLNFIQSFQTVIK